MWYNPIINSTYWLGKEYWRTGIRHGKKGTKMILGAEVTSHEELHVRLLALEKSKKEDTKYA